MIRRLYRLDLSRKDAKSQRSELATDPHRQTQTNGRKKAQNSLSQSPGSTQKPEGRRLEGERRRKSEAEKY